MIDTASNYRGGRSEKAVGYALDALRNLKGFTREMVFVSTKAGFLQDDIKQQVHIQLALCSGCMPACCVHTSELPSPDAFQIPSNNYGIIHCSCLLSALQACCCIIAYLCAHSAMLLLLWQCSYTCTMGLGMVYCMSGNKFCDARGQLCSQPTAAICDCSCWQTRRSAVMTLWEECIACTRPACSSSWNAPCSTSDCKQ